MGDPLGCIFVHNFVLFVGWSVDGIMGYVLYIFDTVDSCLYAIVQKDSVCPGQI